MPARSVVYSWIVQKDREELKEFHKLYAIATKANAIAMGDDCLDIADDSSDDVRIVGGEDNEREVPNTEFIARSRLRVDTRMKLMAKRAPDMFGDSLALTGAGGGPIETKEKNAGPDRDLARRLAFMLMAGSTQPEKADDDGEAA